jgi:hypothetical protein
LGKTEPGEAQMTHPIVCVDTSTIREGKLEDLKHAMQSLAECVETNVPQLLSCAFFLDRDQSQMTVVAVHPDSSSLESHLDVGADEFRKFADLMDLEGIEVYGAASQAVLERLHVKARALGKGTVSQHDFSAGFARL